MCDNRTSEFLSFAKTIPGGGGGGGISSSLLSSRTPTSSSATTGATGAAVTTGADATAASAAKLQQSSQQQFSELRDFHQAAGEISKDIATTSALLSELAQLVKHKSLLKDDAPTINNLVVRIKSNIENLNSRLDHAATTIASQKRKLGKNSQAGQEASNLVDGLKTEFAEAASGFKNILQQRTDNLKETENLQRQVYGGSSDHNNNSLDDDPIPNMSSSALSAPPPVYSSSFGGLGAGGGLHRAQSSPAANNNAFPTIDLTSSISGGGTTTMMSAGEATGQPSGPGLPRPHGITAPNSGGVAMGTAGEYNMRHRRQSGASVDAGIPSYSGSYSTYERQHSAPAPLAPLDIARMEEESGVSQQMQLIPDQDYMQQRADAMETVETNVAALGTIFNKLAVMVNEHKDLVQRVEDNVDEVNTNINLSLNVLTDTLTSLKTNRALALRVFSVLVLFIIFFIIFFA